MSKLKQKLAEKIPASRERISKLVKNHGKVKVDEVTIAQIYGGMRGLKSLSTDISYLDPEEGIRFRGYTIPECLEKLPRAEGAEMPYVEGHFYLLLTGDIPTQEDIEDVLEEFRARRRVPQYVFDLLRAMPRDAHPMSMFSAAVVAMQRESVFVKRYNAGMTKMDYWDPMYEDAVNLLAKLPEIAAYIYRMKYKGDTPIASDPNLDFGANFAHMMGIDHPYDEISRLYFILHSDHESGNVSAHTTHLVATALSDAYYSFAAGLNGLAGPLHGLANQEVLRWVQNLMSKMDKTPTREDLKKYVWDTLNSGQVIPGYGHAVLRKTDPRYTAQREFALKHLPDDDIFKVVSMLYEVVPPILKEHGKAKNPWPNVDAHSGVIQWHYGVKEYDFYTVMFGVGRAIGVLSNIIWDRINGQALERPKSLTTAMLEEIARQNS
ncbi:MAG: citrate (Si)-synthase, eukaryotic [Calditrichaeota bacterium]|nr:MAG: citrate (Si)-synthase, eukaryotic [Calditrichota bacterium]